MLNSAGDHIFTIAPIEVALDRRLSLEQIRVLLALFSFRDKQTGLVFPKRESIAARCGYCPNKISQITSSLVKLGWLVKVGSGGRSAPCQYRLAAPETFPDKGTVIQAKNPRKTPLPGAKTAPDSGTVAEGVTVTDSETVTEWETVTDSVSKTVTESVTKTVTDSVTGKEQTSEQTRNRQHSSSIARASEPPEEDKQPVTTNPGSEGPHEGEGDEPPDNRVEKILSTWTPDDRCWALIESHGIDRAFAESLLGEFKLYWSERNEMRPWSSSFLRWAQAQWKREKKRQQGETNITPLRPVPSGHRNGVGHFRTFEQMRAENTQRAIDEFLYGDNVGVTIDA